MHRQSLSRYFLDALACFDFFRPFPVLPVYMGGTYDAILEIAHWGRGDWEASLLIVGLSEDVSHLGSHSRDVPLFTRLQTVFHNNGAENSLLQNVPPMAFVDTSELLLFLIF